MDYKASSGSYIVSPRLSDVCVSMLCVCLSILSSVYFTSVSYPRRPGPFWFLASSKPPVEPRVTKVPCSSCLVARCGSRVGFRVLFLTVGAGGMCPPPVYGGRVVFWGRARDL